MHRIARIVLGIGSPLVVLACLVGGEAGRLLFVIVTPLIPVALIATGVSRPGAGRRVAWVLLVLALTLEAGSAGVLLLARHGVDASRIAGLPPAAVLALLALGVVPLLLVPACYAALFGARGPGPSSTTDGGTDEASREP